MLAAKRSRPLCELLEGRLLLSGEPLHQPTTADIAKAKLEFQASNALTEVISHALGLSHFDVPASSALEAYVKSDDAAKNLSNDTMWEALKAWIELSADIAIEASQNVQPWVPIFLQTAQLAQVAEDLGVLKETLVKVAAQNQKNLYNDARPFNSAADIANLAPGDLLWDTVSGQPITKTDAGWLLRGTSYLIGFPTDTTPAVLFPMLDADWQMRQTNASLQAEKASVFAPAFRLAVERISSGWPFPSIRVPLRSATADGAVDSISVSFAEPVSGVDLGDFSFGPAGGANTLTAAQTLSTTDGVTYTLGNLTGLTQFAGRYLLKVNAANSGITDASGNGLAGDAAGAITVATPLIRGSAAADTFVARRAANGAATEIFHNIPVGAFPSHVLSSAAADVVTFDAGDGNDTLTVAGSYSPIAFNAGAGANVLNLSGQGIVLRAASTVAGGTLALNVVGGSARIESLLRANALIVANGARLDLGEHGLIVDYAGASPLGTRAGSAYTGIAGLIRTGRTAQGTWDGPGIVTSNPSALLGLTTLAVGEAGNAMGISGTQTAMWNGVAVDATTVLVSYTFAGDADLNGRVDGDDYFAIDSKIASASAWGWWNGDFDYNGKINGDDYFLIDSNIGRHGVVL
ncbi:MAG TPA: hypothetical protein VER17_17235 [Tepidisphaeraceae bacterium]|nr:hypothetical protein [Tepidisphaeraceae bacterium]